MPESENKALVRRLLEELRDGWHPATIEKYFAPDYQRHLTATSTPLTRDEQRQRAIRLRVAFPDAQATLEDIFAEGDRVAYRLTIRGTHTGEFLGVPAAGRRVAVSFIAIVRIVDGKLVEEWGGLDQPDLIRQMRGSPSAS
ncbi:MAG: ester cyclase [Candidatus Rokuibacteriota bacterium]|nr:MAG: ester cyclase [Candidatus Rokubacteria bacterium]